MLQDDLTLLHECNGTIWRNYMSDTGRFDILTTRSLFEKMVCSKSIEKITKYFRDIIKNNGKTINANELTIAIIKLQYKLFIKVLKKIRLWNVNKANIIRSPQVYLHSCWAMPYLNHRRNKYTRSIKNTSKLIDTLCITN